MQGILIMRMLELTRYWTKNISILVMISLTIDFIIYDKDREKNAR